MSTDLSADDDDLGQLDGVGPDRVENVLQFIDHRDERLHGCKIGGAPSKECPCVRREKVCDVNATPVVAANWPLPF
jgi:hypothetical protein